MAPGKVQGIAAIDVSDMLTPKSAGDIVVSHVVKEARQPQPDFDRMNKIVRGLAPADLPTSDVGRVLPKVG